MYQAMHVQSCQCKFNVYVNDCIMTVVIECDDH